MGIKLVGLLLFLTASSAFADPWVPDMGRGVFHAGISGGFGNQELTGFERDKIGRIRMGAIDLYGQVGVLPHIAVTASLPFRYIDVQPSAQRSDLVFTGRGPGDLSLRIQGAALRAPIPLAPHIGVRVPLYSLAWDRPALGPGTLDFEAGLSTGMSWGNVYGFIELSYWLRGQQKIPEGNALIAGDRLDVADQIALDVEIGFRALERLWLIANVSSQIAIPPTANNPGADEAFLESFGLRPSTSTLVLRLKAWLDLVPPNERLGHALTAAIWSTIAGQKIAATTWGSVGYGLRF